MALQRAPYVKRSPLCSLNEECFHAYLSQVFSRQDSADDSIINSNLQPPLSTWRRPPTARNGNQVGHVNDGVGEAAVKEMVLALPLPESHIAACCVQRMFRLCAGHRRHKYNMASATSLGGGNLRPYAMEIHVLRRLPFLEPYLRSYGRIAPSEHIHQGRLCHRALTNARHGTSQDHNCFHAGKHLLECLRPGNVGYDDLQPALIRKQAQHFEQPCFTRLRPHHSSNFECSIAYASL
mmetsp:Transcript_75543/g.179471  ORF Transcript_75543/g.179471 Transcript_75543/m.179471 type:complete len:237 (+) Transcript_75543:553-1263(+)